MPITIKKIDVIIALLFLAVFKFYAIPQAVQQASKIVFLVIVLLYLLSYVPIASWFNISLALCFVFALPSFLSFFSHDITAKVFLDGLLNVICIYAIYMVIQLCAQKGMLDRMIYDLYIFTALYCVISLVSILVVGPSSSLSGTEKTYFFGNKFSTSYLFIMLAALYYTVHMKSFTAKWKYKMNYLAICILAILISAWIHCFTAVLGALVLFLAVMIPDKIKNYIMSPVFIIMGIVIAGLVVYSITSFLAIPQVQYIVINIFGKNAGLTGRVYIYNNLLNIIRARPVWGYGYNSSIVEEVIGYGTAQNGLMELMINYGCVGIVSFLYTVYYCISRSGKDSRVYGLYIFILVMIVCSVVEISYNYYFYLILFAIRWFQRSYIKQ